jgi:hypothetical protein
VGALREAGHDVYDFRNPCPGNTGFSWADIDPNWQAWTAQQYREALKHPIAKDGYALDIGALRACDTCVLVLPSGRSASWEFGYAMGQGKRGAVLQTDAVEPELMYHEAEIVTSLAELLLWCGGPPETPTHYGLFREICPDSPMIKEANFFIKQGGLVEEWGQHWEPIYGASSIGEARRMFARTKGVALSSLYFDEP